MHNDDFYNNLVNFLKMFKNRPNHLAKYLLDNSAINKDFINKISNNDQLKNLSNEDDLLSSPIYFADINKMNDYYNSFTEDIKKLNKGKTPEEIEREMNDQLNKFIYDEKYEDAARLRDYMQRSKIKRNKK
jgi:hypothetical protein